MADTVLQTVPLGFPLLEAEQANTDDDGHTAEVTVIAGSRGRPTSLSTRTAPAGSARGHPRGAGPHLIRSPDVRITAVS